MLAAGIGLGSVCKPGIVLLARVVYARRRQIPSQCFSPPSACV